MGKASRWIRNFLLGKKEYRKRIDTSLPLEFKSTKLESQPSTPKVKRKWSFRKSAGKNGSRKFSKSFDSIEVGKIPTQPSPEPLKALAFIRGHMENVAATKIQATFRSYLARRALHALRGLVKLQALVRGYIVRKQTASTLKRMHALMSIQVRARFQRIQMAEETQLVTRSQLSMDDSFVRDNNRDANLVSKSSSDHLNHIQIKMINAPLYTDHLYEGYTFDTADNSPRNYSVTSRLSPHHRYEYSLLPNYMINTESSRAKVRSQSEPKQRPTMQNDKQIEIAGVMRSSLDDSVTKRSSKPSKFNTSENHDPWFFKLYKAERSSRVSNCDSIPDSIRHSNCYRSFADYEANFNRY